MSKATKVFLILFVSVFTAGVASNIICEIFKTRTSEILFCRLNTAFLSGRLLPSFFFTKNFPQS